MRRFSVLAKETAGSVFLTFVAGLVCLGANVLENSSFEVGLAHGWGRDGTSFRPFVESLDICTTQAYHGNCSFRLWTSSRREDGYGGTQTLMSKAYRLRPNTRYSFSVWVRGTSPRMFVVLGAKNSFADSWCPADSHVWSGQAQTPQVSVGTNWTRIGFTFTTTTNVEMCSYHVWFRPYAIETPGHYLLFDAVQLSVVSNDYAPAQPLEFGLGQLTNSGVWLDEPPKVAVRIWNDTRYTSNVTAQLTVWDYFNKLAYSNQLVLTCPPGLSSTNITLHALTNYGCYRIVGWLDGVAQSIDELNVAHLPKPHTWGIDPRGHFGSHIPFDEYWLELHQKLGFKWNCTLSTGRQLYWCEVETAPGVYRFFDEDFARAKKYGFSILGTMYSGVGWSGVPRWYKWSNAWTVVTFNDNDPNPDTITKDGGPAFDEVLRPEDIVMVADWWWTGSGWDTRTWTNNGVYRITAVTSNSITLAITNNIVGGLRATNLQIVVLDSAAGTNRGWTAFVQAMADRYGRAGQTNTVDAWEPITEPDTETDMDHCPQGTAYLIASAAQRFKAVNPDCIIVGICAWSPSYIRDVLQYLDPSHFDVLSSHFFAPGETSVGGQFQGNAVYRNVTNFLVALGKQGWNTQSGARSRSFYQTILWEDLWPAGGWAKTNPDIARDHKQKTDRLTQNIFVSMGIATQGFSYEKYFNYDSRHTQTPAVPNAYSIIEYDGTVRPRGVALAIAAHFIDYYKGQCFRRLNPPGGPTNVNAYLFTREGYDPVVVVHACVSNVVYRLFTSLPSEKVQAYNLVGAPLDIAHSIDFEMSPIYLRGRGVTGAQLMDSLTISNSVDTAGPNLSLVTFPTAPVKKSETVDFRWFALDDLTYDFFTSGVYAWRLPGYQDEWSQWMSATNFVTGVTVSAAALPLGTNTFYVKAKDPAGNESIVSWHFRVVPDVQGPANLRIVAVQ